MKRIALLSLILTALAACGPQAVGGGELAPIYAWIDAPLDGATIPQAAYTLVFSGASALNPVDQFELKINGLLAGLVPPSYQTTQQANQYSYAEYEWLPAASGTYLIEVRAFSGGAAGPFAQAIGSVGEPTAEAPDEIQPGEIPAIEEKVLIAIPGQNANCRLGNSSTYFDVVDTLFEGMEYSPIARGADNLWLVFAGPNYGGTCWVYIQGVQLYLNETPVVIENVSEDMLPYAPYPATPTPSPTPTFTPEPSATAAPRPQCDDGIDNDGDGDIDMDDGRCLSPDDDSESS